MDIKGKLSLLEKFRTKELWDSICEQEQIINLCVSSIIKFQAENSIHLASHGDSKKVQEHELRIRSEFVAPDDKKITVAQREELIKQAISKDPAWKEAVTAQLKATASYDDLQHQLEAATRKYSALMALLRLRTAQIQFLAGEGK